MRTYVDLYSGNASFRVSRFQGYWRCVSSHAVSSTFAKKEMLKRVALSRIAVYFAHAFYEETAWQLG